jgi:hypothetical protein
MFIFSRAAAASHNFDTHCIQDSASDHRDMLPTHVHTHTCICGDACGGSQGDTCVLLQRHTRGYTAASPDAERKGRRAARYRYTAAPPRDFYRYCLGSPHCLGLLRGTYGQPDDSQCVLLATLSRVAANVFLGSTLFAQKRLRLHQSVRRGQIHVTGGLVDSRTHALSLV